MIFLKIKKPQYTSWQWAKFIVIPVLFPPVLLWDLKNSSGESGFAFFKAFVEKAHKDDAITLQTPTQKV